MVQVLTDHLFTSPQRLRAPHFGQNCLCFSGPRGLSWGFEAAQIRHRCTRKQRYGSHVPLDRNLAQHYANMTPEAFQNGAWACIPGHVLHSSFFGSWDSPRTKKASRPTIEAPRPFQEVSWTHFKLRWSQQDHQNPLELTFQSFQTRVFRCSGSLFAVAPKYLIDSMRFNASRGHPASVKRWLTLTPRKDTQIKSRNENL